MPHFLNLSVFYKEVLERWFCSILLTELEYNYVGGDPLQEDFGLLLQSSLEPLGLTVNVVGLTGGEYIGRLESSETAAHFNWIWAASDYPDAEIIFFPQYHSSKHGAWFSSTFYQNEEFDSLIEEARRTVDDEARLAIYQQLQEILIEDAADIWVYTRHFVMAKSDALDGFAYQPAGMDSTYFYPISLLD